MTDMTREERIIWAAGFFDGEGCICITNRVRPGGTVNQHVQMSVAQKVREPLDILVELWGGKVYVAKWKNSQGFQWHMSHKRIEEPLFDMLPYLVVKRAKAEEALAFRAKKLMVP